jgi:hypothetical protein
VDVGDYEECLLGCGAVWDLLKPTFQRSVSSCHVSVSSYC